MLGGGRGEAVAGGGGGEAVAGGSGGERGMGSGFGELRGRGGRAVGIKYFLRVKLLTCPSDGTWWKNGSVQSSSTLMGHSVNLRWWTFWLGAVGAKIVHVRGYSCRQMIFRTLQRIYIYILFVTRIGKAYVSLHAIY